MSIIIVEENRQLKNEIKTMTVLSAELEKTHSSQMTEALENLNTRSETYKAEIASQQHQAQLKCREVLYNSCMVFNPSPATYTVRQEMDDKEKEIQDKITEIKLLQREKAEVERMRHTDIVKLRLEVRGNGNVTIIAINCIIHSCSMMPRC